MQEACKLVWAVLEGKNPSLHTPLARHRGREPHSLKFRHSEQLAALLSTGEKLLLLTCARFHSEDRPEPEQVLAPEETSSPTSDVGFATHPFPQRVHLATTDGEPTLDLETSLESFLRVESPGQVEFYRWPEL